MTATPERPLSSIERRIDADWAFRRYESVRPRLPQATFPERAGRAANLLALAEEFDVFLLDAFGVLNVGAAPIPGAVEAVVELTARGKRLLVLTNGATQDIEDTLAKYRKFGLPFEREQVISSRALLAAGLASHARHSGNPEAMVWGFAAPAHAKLERLPVATARLADAPELYDRVDGFVLLSTAGWTETRQRLLYASLRAKPRPLLVGNPDIVAPHEAGFSIEPGFYAHELADALGLAPEFYGKPFANAFVESLARLGRAGGAAGDPARVAMVGDTLHTDILGGAAAGFRTVLVARHGLFRGLDPAPFIEASGIVPDFIVETT